MQVIPKYYTILYKGLEHPQILVSTGVPGINPLWILKGDWSHRPSISMERFLCAWHFACAYITQSSCIALYLVGISISILHMKNEAQEIW